MNIACRHRRVGVVIRADGSAQLFIDGPETQVNISIQPMGAWALAARYGLLIVAEPIPGEDE